MRSKMIASKTRHPSHAARSPDPHRLYPISHVLARQSSSPPQLLQASIVATIQVDIDE